MQGKVLNALILTTIAGLSTGIGGAIAFFAKKTNVKFLSVSLGFSAGVMIYISMTELFSEANKILAEQFGAQKGAAFAAAAFFCGILLIAIIDRLVPEKENPHEIRPRDESPKSEQNPPPRALLRTGIFAAFAVAIHNFPEGLATFIAAMREPSVALPIVCAIAIHNIPEGIAVATPVYYATGSRGKAFAYSFASGLAEPMGAVIGWAILTPFMSEALYGALFAVTAGIMVFISLDELLPAAEAYGEHHLSMYGLIAGMAVMAASLLSFM